MSKFIDSIYKYLLYQKPTNVHLSAHINKSECSSECLDVYQFEVIWRCEAAVDPGLANSGGHDVLMDQMVRRLKEDLYGEFRNRLYDLELAVYERDDSRVQSVIRDIITECF